MKFLLLAAFVGFCSAVYVPSGRQILIGNERNIAVHGLQGNQYVFTHYPTEKYFDIVINGVDTPAKRVHINDQTCHILNLQGFPKVHQVYQHGQVHENVIGGGYLLNVLKQFQGPIGEEQFHDLLQTVHRGVEHKQICHIIYHLLAHLDEEVNEDLIEKYFVQQQHFGGRFVGQQLYGQQLAGRQWGGLPWVTGKVQQYPGVGQLTRPYVWGQQPWNVQHYQRGLYNVPEVYNSGIKSVWGQYPYGYVQHTYGQYPYGYAKQTYGQYPYGYAKQTYGQYPYGYEKQTYGQYPYGYVPHFYQRGVGQQQGVIPAY